MIGAKDGARDGACDAAAAVVRRVAEVRARGAPLVVMLDVDGTIAPIVPRPDQAAVPVETRRVLAALAACPAARLALVSGRAAADAARVLGLGAQHGEDAGIVRPWVVGNHGAEVVAPDGAAHVDPQVAAYEAHVAAAARELAAAVAAVPGATLEDKRWSLTLHYRTVADHAGVLALGRAARAAAARHALDVRRGKKVFELRAPVRVDKGTAVLRLARELGADAPGAAALYAGDDVTDEDAFRALRAGLPSAVTVRVAADDADPARDTSAEFTVLGLPAFREVLARLASAE